MCGSTKKFHVKRTTWWWDDNVDQLISTKRKLWKAWKAGGDKEPYLAAKREAKQGVFHAKREAEKKWFSTLKHGDQEIFRQARQLRKTNRDVIGEKYLKDDTGSLSISDVAKKTAWKQHYERLLNVEFPWDSEHLSDADPVVGPPLLITPEMVSKSVSKMKHHLQQ